MCHEGTTEDLKEAQQQCCREEAVEAAELVGEDAKLPLEDMADRCQPAGVQKAGQISSMPWQNLQAAD